MVRTIVVPDDTHIELIVPADYVGKKVEVSFFLLDEITGPKPEGSTMGDFWGILSDESANAIRSEMRNSRGEWERDI